jgi:hypothetical protein
MIRSYRRSEMKKLFLLVIILIAVFAIFGSSGKKQGDTVAKNTASMVESKPHTGGMEPVSKGLKPNPLSAGLKPEPEPEKADPYKDYESYSHMSEAKEFGKEALLKVLKHPHDASFPWFGVDVAFQRPAMKGIPPFYYVFGTVEAKNDFGAALTKDFKVCVQANTSDKSLAIRFIEFDGKTVYRDEELFSAQARALDEATQREDREYHEKLKQKQAKLKAEKLAEQAKWAKEHPEEAAKKKFGGVLANAKSLIKSRIYPDAKKRLQRIIDEAPGTEVAQEAQEVLATIPQ